ncbi:MAG: NAD(P)H-dependent oxidoreductase [Clostridiales bacterium]|nr:NAD(P)H-dependent oxidoreductase [Clostridiales bacterium]
MNKSEILLICTSPRRKGTSAMLLERVRAAIGGKMIFLPQSGSLNELVSEMQQAETIIISGPCYINTYPAKLIELLETASFTGGFSGQKIYGIINGGMPYIHTHKHGLTCLELFADKNNLSWQGGFILGVGAMLDGKPLEKHMSRRKVVPAFDQFVRYITSGKQSPDSLYIDVQSPPGKLMTYLFSKLLSSMVVKRIKKYGYDPEAPNWYLSNR